MPNRECLTTKIYTQGMNEIRFRCITSDITCKSSRFDYNTTLPNYLYPGLARDPFESYDFLLVLTYFVFQLNR